MAENNFSDLLYYRLSNITQQDNFIPDMTEEILHRIQNAVGIQILSGFCLQNQNEAVYLQPHQPCTAPYFVRHQRYRTAPPTPRNPFCAICKASWFPPGKSFLLRRKTTVPIITKPADGKENILNFYNALPENARYLYEKDIFCSNLYRQVQNNALHCCRGNEYCCQPIIYS